MGDWKELLRTALFQTWRRRWIAIGIAWAACVIGWIGVAMIPNTYKSRTRIYVDAESMLGPLLKGMAVEQNVTKQVEVVQRTLLSRPNIEKVMRQTDLDIQATTPARREAMIAMIEQKTKIQAEAARNLFNIEYTDQNPELARKVLQEFLAIFIESNIGVQRKDMENSYQFIVSQVANYERQVRETEARVTEFREKYRDVLPAALGGEGSFAANMNAARTRLASTKREMDDAVAKRSVLARQLGGVPRFLEVQQRYAAGTGQPAIMDLNRRIAEAESNLASLLIRFTESHPDVRAQRRMLDDMQKQRKESGESSANESLTEKVSNPVYEQLQIKFSDAETSVEMLQRRYADQKKDMEQLEGMAGTIPKIESEYANLTREFGIIKTKYNEMLERREAARLSNEVDTKANKVDFRIIEPPVLPIQPAFPNRALLSALVFFASIGGGVFVAYGLAQFDDSFSSPKELRNALPYPVIGTVTMVTSPESVRARRRGMVTFASAFCLLIVAYGGVSAITAMGIGTAQLAQYRTMLPFKL